MLLFAIYSTFQFQVDTKADRKASIPCALFLKTTFVSSYQYRVSTYFNDVSCTNTLLPSRRILLRRQVRRRDFPLIK